jgi:spermidine/putrescine transport system ATP-binding protein
VIRETPFGNLRTTQELPDPGTKVTLAVRPEKFHIAADGAAPESMNAISGTVKQAVYSGSSVTYLIDTGAQEFRVFQQNRELNLYQPGAAVTLSWSPEHTVVVTA